MAEQPVEMILARQWVGYLSVPVILVDTAGEVVFYNEPAERILGVRFEETGRIDREEVDRLVELPDDPAGKPGDAGHPLAQVGAETMGVLDDVSETDGAEPRKAVKIAVLAEERGNTRFATQCHDLCVVHEVAGGMSLANGVAEQRPEPITRREHVKTR